MIYKKAGKYVNPESTGKEVQVLPYRTVHD